MTKRDELERGLHRLGTDVVLRARPRACLLDGLAREHAERDRDREGCGELSKGSRDRMREDVKVGGLTSDQTAERNDRIETSRSREHRDRRRQLERAGNLELLHFRACGERGRYSALGQCAGDLVVPARSDDRDPRAGVSILSPRRSLPTGRHLPQSSPRMHYRPVSA
jgi:hypothetical protein